MNSLVKKLCDKYNLEIINELSLGNVCNSVYKVRDSRGQELVLKIGLTKESVAEIRMNMRGYEEMDRNNLSFFRPEIIANEDRDGCSMILMEKYWKYWGQSIGVRS